VLERTTIADAVAGRAISIDALPAAKQMA